MEVVDGNATGLRSFELHILVCKHYFLHNINWNTEQNLSCLWWKSIAERKWRELRGEITNSQQMAQWKALQATKCTGERTDNRQSEKLTSVQFIQSRNDNDIWCVWKTNAVVYFKSFIVIFNHQQIIIFL